MVGVNVLGEDDKLTRIVGPVAQGVKVERASHRGCRRRSLNAGERMPYRTHYQPFTSHPPQLHRNRGHGRYTESHGMHPVRTAFADRRVERTCAIGIGHRGGVHQSKGHDRRCRMLRIRRVRCGAGCIRLGGGGAKRRSAGSSPRIPESVVTGPNRCSCPSSWSRPCVSLGPRASRTTRPKRADRRC